MFLWPPSDSDLRSVEPGKGKGDVIVVGRLLLLEDTYRHLLTQPERVDRIRPPVNAGSIPPGSNVRGDLVEFASDRRRRTIVGHERGPVSRRNHRVPDRVALVKERLERRDTCPSHRCMA